MDRLTTIPKLNWPEWQAEYRSSLCVGVLWYRLQSPKPKVRQEIVGNGDWMVPHLYYPWYSKGTGYRDDVPPKEVDLLTSRGQFILRIPALELIEANGMCHGFLVLDGCQRLRDLKPRVIIIDYISVRHDKLKYFNDLLSPHWRKVLKI